MLMMIGYGDKTRTQEHLCDLFNNKYLEQITTESTIEKNVKKREVGHMEEL